MIDYGKHMEKWLGASADGSVETTTTQILAMLYDLEKEVMSPDLSKLTHTGSMNYVLQIWDSGMNDIDPPADVEIDQYQPRRNTIWKGEVDRERAKEDIRETIERMKIAITRFNLYLEGKIDTVYYWDPIKEEEIKSN